MSKKKRVDEDDGRSFADMNVPGMPGYVPKSQKEKRKKADSLQLTRKEKLALIKAAYIQVLPLIGILALGFLVAGGLVTLWLWLGGAL